MAGLYGALRYRPYALRLWLGLQRDNLANAPWVHGLQLVAVAVVAQGVWSMARQFLTDELRIAIAIVTTLVLLFVPSSVGQVAVIVPTGLVGRRLLESAAAGIAPACRRADLSPIRRRGLDHLLAGPGAWLRVVRYQKLPCP